MKIVFNTQVRENYGAHDWDGMGECPQYWKNKGGNTYVFTNVSIAQAQSRDYWEKLELSIICADDYLEEYVIHNEIINDDEEPQVEEWDRKWIKYIEVA